MHRTTIAMLALFAVAAVEPVVHAQSSLLFNRPTQDIPSMQGRYDVRTRSMRQGRVYTDYQPAYAARDAVQNSRQRGFPANSRQRGYPTHSQQPGFSAGQVFGRVSSNQAGQKGLDAGRFNPGPGNQGLGADNGQSMFAQPTPRGFSNNRSSYYPPAVMPTRRLSETGYYVPSTQAVEIRKHDIITVRVDIIARTQSEGNSEMRRTANYDLSLTDWIVVNWFRWIKPSPQSQGDPRIAGTLNRQNRAEGEIDTSERLSFNIASEVRDIYPNGNLLLGGNNFIRLNNEVWKVSLSGVCRPKDIGPNNTVLSSNILNLNIKKEEQGQVRDAYRRGWFTRWFDRFHPF